jgi:hypothetical protein
MLYIVNVLSLKQIFPLQNVNQEYGLDVVHVVLFFVYIISIALMFTKDLFHWIQHIEFLLQDQIPRCFGFLYHMVLSVNMAHQETNMSPFCRKPQVQVKSCNLYYGLL